MQLARTKFNTLILILFLTNLNVFNTKHIVRSPKLMLVVWTELTNFSLSWYFSKEYLSVVVDLRFLYYSCLFPRKFVVVLIEYQVWRLWYVKNYSRSMIIVYEKYDEKSIWTLHVCIAMYNKYSAIVVSCGRYGKDNVTLASNDE